MSKIAVITDSIACLNREHVDRYGIYVVPLVVTADGHIYHDWVELSPSAGYRLLEEHTGSFMAAPPSPGEFLAAYRQAAASADGIVCVTLASRLSTTHRSALTAREMASTDLPGLPVEVLDSRSGSMGQGFIALAAARAAQEGEGLDAVLKVAERVRERVKVAMVLETVRYIYRTGRAPRLVSWLGAMVHIRPILTLSEGVVRPLGLARTKASGVERLLKLLRQSTGRGDGLHVAVVHADAADEAQDLRARIQAEFECAELFIAEFSPIMAYAVGRGVVGLAFYRG